MEELWILYGEHFDNNEDNSAKRMLNEALNQGIEAKLLFHNYFSLSNNDIYYKKDLVKAFPKLIFFRGHNVELSKAFEDKGVKVINSSFTTKVCRDKWLTYSELKDLDVNHIKTILLSEVACFSEVKEKVGLPFILKYRHGAQGNNIYKIEDEDFFIDILKGINKEEYIVQEYISTSFGKDLRVYVIGNNILGACIRQNEDSFMSNIHQGGKSYHFELNDKLKKSSLEIAKKLKGDIISVDYLFGNDDKLLFCEANTNAGFASFNFLGYNTRYEMMKYIKSLLEV